MVFGAVAQGHEDSPLSLGRVPYPVPKYVSFFSLWALSVLAQQIRDVVRHSFLPVSCGKEGGAAPPRGPSRRYPPAAPVSLALPAVCRLDVTLISPQHLVSSKACSTEFQSSGLSMAILFLSGRFANTKVLYTDDCCRGRFGEVLWGKHGLKTFFKHDEEGVYYI